MGKLKSLSESAENYLKTILILQNRLGEVRSVDVARELGVSRPSVSYAIKKLHEEGLVFMDEKRRLILTEEGFGHANFIFQRHVVIEKFLTDVLGVDESTAHDDSCRIEHLISKETLSRLHDAGEGADDEEIQEG